MSDSRSTPIPNLRLGHVADFWDSSSDAQQTVTPVDKIEDANVVTSMTEWNPTRHKLVLDIDHEAKLVPSTTPGHYHLYIDVQIYHDEYMHLLTALAEAGVIEWGYNNAAQKRGYTCVRLPWIIKEDKDGQPLA